MSQLPRILEFLDTLLEPSKFEDSAYNGLQVDGGIESAVTICGAVDSGLSVIQEASRLKADLLIVHHGLFWHGSSNIANGLHGAKLRELFLSQCSLYASHLPLDGNLEVGNSAEILRLLGIKSFHPFALEGRMTLGAQGELDFACSIEEILSSLRMIEGYGPEVVLPFGKNSIRTIGVCTGAGGFCIDEAKRVGIDLLISGEPKQHNYHHAKELGQNVIFIGHYASETFGVKALLRVLENTFGVKTIWISEPTGI